MKRTFVAVGLIAVWLVVVPGWSQEAEVEKLRKQITALNEQLERLESDDNSNRRVTELGSSRRHERNPELSVRLYDLGDLFALAPAYPAVHGGDLGGGAGLVFPSATNAASSGGGFGGGGGGFFRVEDRPQSVRDDRPTTLHQEGSQSSDATGGRTSMDDLVHAITSIISPESWDEVGGPGSIAQLGTTLVISTDRNNHEQIEALLTQFRQKWRTLRTLSVRAWWLWLTDAELAPLLAERAENPAAAEETAFGVVDAAAWDALLARLAEGGEERAGYRAAVTCYNGQTVHTVSGGQSQFVTNLEPIVGEDADGNRRGPVAYQPEVTVVEEGAALQVTPLASLSGKYVILDVHSRVSTLQREQQGRGRQEQLVEDFPAPRDVVAAIDRPVLSSQRLSTTLRVPTDRTTLVGGMTFESRPQPGEPSLYLFVKIAVQELRDDLPEAAQPVGEPAVDERPADDEATEE